MKKVTVFLASSNELLAERQLFEIEIYRKCKAWFDQGVFLHLDVWEDLSARMSSDRLQGEYNKKVKDADLFVLLAYTKVGMYTEEEFEQAFGQFKATEKPFIFTYFKKTEEAVDGSLTQFQQKLDSLGHFYSSFGDSKDLWNQFNKELEWLEKDGFREHPEAGGAGGIHINNSTVEVRLGKTYHQKGTIINIKNVENGNF